MAVSQGFCLDGVCQGANVPPPRDILGQKGAGVTVSSAVVGWTTLVPSNTSSTQYPSTHQLSRSHGSSSWMRVCELTNGVFVASRTATLLCCAVSCESQAWSGRQIILSCGSCIGPATYWLDTCSPSPSASYVASSDWLLSLSCWSPCSLYEYSCNKCSGERP